MNEKFIKAWAWLKPQLTTFQGRKVLNAFALIYVLYMFIDGGIKMYQSSEHHAWFLAGMWQWFAAIFWGLWFAQMRLTESGSRIIKEVFGLMDASDKAHGELEKALFEKCQLLETKCRLLEEENKLLKAKS